MSKIDEIMELAQSYSDSQQHTSEARNIARAELRHLIAAALADARREGAEEMREAAGDAAQRATDALGHLNFDLEAANKERDELASGMRALRARLAEIEAQEPVLWSYTTDGPAKGVRHYTERRAVAMTSCKPGSLTPFYARPVPAQAVPGGWRLMAWAHEDGRVIPVTMIDNAKRDGGATFSSVKAYTIALYAAPEYKA